MTYNINYIYIFLFPNGKRYVGQTIQSVEERARKHWNDTDNSSHLPVHNAMRKYGRSNVQIEKIFALICSQEYLDLLEDLFITRLNTLVPHGYNLRGGGHGGRLTEKQKRHLSKIRTGTHHTQETRIKISAILKGNTRRLGTHHSEKTRAKMSKSHAGRVGYWKDKSHSAETKLKMVMNSPWKGVKRPPRTEEHRQKLSMARKGRPWSPARRKAQEAKHE